MTEHTCRYTLQMPSTVPDQGLKVHAESLLTCSFMFGCIGSSLLHAGKWSFSLVVVHGFGCPMACEISPDQRLRIEPVSPVLAGGFLSTRPSGKSTCRSVGSLCAFPTSLISCSANSCCLSSLEFGSVHLSSSRLLCPVGFTDPAPSLPPLPSLTLDRCSWLHHRGQTDHPYLCCLPSMVWPHIAVQKYLCSLPA